MSGWFNRRLLPTVSSPPSAKKIFDLAIACAFAVSLNVGAANAQPLTTKSLSGKELLEAELAGAESGKVQSQLKIAHLYLNGKEIPRDRSKASDFFAAAVLNGSEDAVAELRKLAGSREPRAQLYLGRLLIASGEPGKAAEGSRLLRIGANAGSVEANFILASVLAGSRSRSDRIEAAVRFGDVAESDTKLRVISRVMAIEARRRSGGADLRLARGMPLPREVRWPVKSSERQASYSHWNLNSEVLLSPGTLTSVVEPRLFEAAEALLSGDPIGADLTFLWLRSRCVSNGKISPLHCAAFYDTLYFHRGANFFHLLSDVGGVPRIIDVGHAFELGVGTAPDPTRALGFYKLAEDSSDNAVRREALYRLSLLAERGVGGPRNSRRASELLQSAALLGHPTAAYTQALGKWKTARTADDWNDIGLDLERAADGGIADGAYRLATLIRQNKYRVKDPGAAIYKNYMKAATQGHLRAVFGLGSAYWNGWGVARDSRQAGKWFERAARSGDPEAAWWSAMMYVDRQDLAGAIPWLRRAAQGGYPGAQAQLQEVMASGHRERNLAGFLASVLDFAGEAMGSVAEGMAQAQAYQQAQLDAQIREGLMVNAAIYASGGYSTVATRSSSSSDSSSQSNWDAAPSSNSSFESEGQTYDALNSADGRAAPERASSASGNASGGSSEAAGQSEGSDMPASAASAPHEDSSSTQSGSSNGAIIVSDGKKEQAEEDARLAALQARIAKQEALIREQNEIAAADIRRKDEELRRKREEANLRATIACYGSVEAAKRARVSCQ